MKTATIKKYIKLIEQEGTQQLLLLLLEYNQPGIHRNAHMVTLDEFILHLKRQVPQQNNILQKDLETEIAEIKGKL